MPAVQVIWVNIVQWRRYTPGRVRSNDLAGRSTALAPPCLLLYFIYLLYKS